MFQSKNIIALLAGLLVGAVLLMSLVRAFTGAPDEPGGGKERALIGGAFTLTDHTGKRVTDKSYRGKYLLVYFGYTYCPEICPTSLQSIADAMEQLGPLADAIVPLFVTVDPERDTTDQLADYVSNFDPRTVGLTGSPEELRVAAKAYRIYSKKVVLEDVVDFDHSSVTYFMDRNGVYLTHFAYGESGGKMAAKIAALVKSQTPQRLSDRLRQSSKTATQ